MERRRSVFPLTAGEIELNLEQVDRKKLIPLLDELRKAVEELLLTGLTTASDSTVKTLSVTFQESSRMGLLRLGATLRAVNEEVARYAKNDADFSRRRLSFFLNRSWLLSKAIRAAVETENGEQFESLMWTPSPKPVDRIEVVTVGVVKRAASTFCAFDFRLRPISDSGHLKRGDKLIWSCVFPRAPGSEVPPEGYLHLPQKQKFKAINFLDAKTISIEKVNASLDVTGCQRISLGEDSIVELGEPFTDWEPFLQWDRLAALEKVKQHEPGPFDLEVELQEEVFFKDWRIEETRETDEGSIVFAMLAETLTCEATVSKAPDQSILMKEMKSFEHARMCPGTIFGLMHYERCKLVFQPLTVFEKKGPKHLMISPEKVDPKALLSTLKF